MKFKFKLTKNNILTYSPSSVNAKIKVIADNKKIVQNTNTGKLVSKAKKGMTTATISGIKMNVIIGR